MATTIKNLEDELRTLMVKRDSIDLQRLESVLATAQAELAAHTEIWPDPQAIQLQQAESSARQALANGHCARRDVENLIQPLASMLGSPARKAQAQCDLEALQAQATQAQRVLTDTAQVLAELQARHAEAVAQISADRELTARAIFDGAKRGETIAACSPDRGPVLALEAALALAEGEHQAASTVLTSVQGKIAVAEQELRHATEDVALLQFELCMRDFTQEARRVLDSTRDFGISDILDAISQRVYALGA